MSEVRASMIERAQDLVIAQNSCGLSPSEAQELRELLEAVPESDVRGLERTIDATRRVVLGAGSIELPGDLRDRLIQSARAVSRDEPKDSIPLESARPAASGGRGWRMLALAACLALAAVLAWQMIGPAQKTPSADIAAIDRATDVVQIAFKSGEGSLAGASGTVVWSDALQAGYMKISGAKPNDPAAMQYQLWIVDPARDSKPVDGGVFDIAQATQTGGAVLVPFKSRLKVASPQVFAITAEKPGGVVVSAGPLIMVASR